MASIPEERLGEFFAGVAIELEEAIRDRLGKLGIKFTGAGMSSVRVKFVKNKLVITMEGYLEYIEFGMPNPTTPEELELWVRTKLLDNFKGKPAAKAAALKRITTNLARKISLFGPRPQPFLRPTLHQDLPKIIKDNIARLSD